MVVEPIQPFEDRFYYMIDKLEFSKWRIGHNMVHKKDIYSKKGFMLIK